MTVAKQGSSITMTAVLDAYTGIVSVAAIIFEGSGLTAGQRLTVTDTDGSVIADHLVSGTTDNTDLLNGRQPQVYQGIKIPATTVGGTWVLTIVLE